MGWWIMYAMGFFCVFAVGRAIKMSNDERHDREVGEKMAQASRFIKLR